MDLHEYTVTATIKVRATSHTAAAEFVIGCLANESAINPALDVVTVEADEDPREAPAELKTEIQRERYWALIDGGVDDTLALRDAKKW